MKFIISKIKSIRYYVYGNRSFRIFFFMNILLIIISSVLLTLSGMGKVYKYSAGDISEETVRVQWDIFYNIEDQTEIQRRTAGENVPLQFDYDRSVMEYSIKRLYGIFRAVNSAGTFSTLPDDDNLLSGYPEYSRHGKRFTSAISDFRYSDVLKNTAVSAVTDIMESGILESRFTPPQGMPNKKAVYIDYSENRQVGQLRDLSGLKTSEEIIQDLPRIISPYIRRFPAEQQWALSLLIRNSIHPNITFNEPETKKLIENARKEVKPVIGILKKDQILAREGDPISPEVLARIKIINKHSSRVHFNFIIGVIIFQILIYFIITMYLKDYFARTISGFKIPLVTFILVTSFFLYSFFAYGRISESGFNYIYGLVLPVPFAVITLCLLYNVYIAFLAGVYCVVFVNVISGGDNSSTIIAAASLLISIFASKKIERRTDFLNAGIGISLMYSFLTAAMGLIDDYSYQKIGSSIKISFISGLANTIAVMGLFPIFEHLFGVTTRFRLLELMDLNSEIFKKMLIKAPGTYNHSIMVANLSEAAAKEISADHYLAKVGAYYHDIGKIENASIYIENKKDGEKTEMDPFDYCRLIISHVEKGIRMAKEMNLPDEISGFIREHHGESTMTFFYHQALEQVNNAGGKGFVHQSDFQYPGPKPHTKETAIVMLADAIEAASRSVHDPSYAKLETLVKKITHNKLNEGELENCDLTFKDIKKIQKAFIRVLAGIFHTRIEYPEKDDIRRLEMKVNKTDE